MSLSRLPERLRAFPSLWVRRCSGDDMEGCDSQSRALSDPGQSLVFLLWLLCYHRFNYNPALLAYLACSHAFASSSLAASPPSTATVAPAGEQALGPWDEEARVPTLARDPGVSTGLESRTPLQARQHGAQPLLAARSWVVAFGEQRCCQKGGGRTLHTGGASSWS